MESWLSGPIPGVPPLLMPVAHTLVQAKHDLHHAVQDLTPDQLWVKPGGAASVGWHLRHLAQALDRLFAYAQGQPLSAEQRAGLALERDPDAPKESADALLALVAGMFDKAMATVKATDPAALLEPRYIGAKRLETNVLGALFHAAEHTQRHTGQVITTAKIVLGP